METLILIIVLAVFFVAVVTEMGWLLLVRPSWSVMNFFSCA